MRRDKTVVIHQPDFLPYLGFFHKLINADLYVILDNVQFLRGSKRWHNRDMIKTPHGAKWLTVSVKKTSRETIINEIMLTDDVVWKTKNINLIKENYKKAKYYEDIFPYIEKLYYLKYDKLIDFNLESITMLMRLFDIRIEMVAGSSLGVSGKGNALLVDIIKSVHATRYLSGVGAKAYYDPRPFKEANIEVIWQDFKHPVYPQLHGDFIPYLSSIDILFNCGIEKSREILKSC